MDFWIHILEFFDIQMEKPEPYGWFHLSFFAFFIALTVLFAVWHRGKQKHVRFMLLFVSILVILLEVYKQVNYSFTVSDGVIEFDGAKPVNPTGGLIGGGHPQSATGVRMFLDLYKQLTGTAGECQVPKDVKNGLMLNMGGSATSNYAFILGME